MHESGWQGFSAAQLASDDEKRGKKVEEAYDVAFQERYPDQCLRTS